MADWPLIKQRTRDFSRLMLEQLRQHNCVKSAASLTYVTLFALVPFMTVTYAMFTAIPAFQALGAQLQEMIFAHMVPETGEEVLAYLQEFTQQARRLTVVGIIFLVGSAYFMLANIETQFNAIWGGLRPRSGVAKFLLYWAVLTLGPLLMGAGLAMSTYLLSIQALDEYLSLGEFTWVLGLMPWLLTTAGFTFLYSVVPNCRVPLRHALIGGVTTALAFEVLKVLFGLVAANSTFASIYGAFAVVPLFLLWINISWLTILVGGVLVHTISVYQWSVQDRGFSDLSAALMVLWRFHQNAERGDSLNSQDLAKLGLSYHQWQRVVGRLQEHRMVTTTSLGNYVLARDLDKVKVSELAEMLALPALVTDMPADLEGVPWRTSFAQRLATIRETTRNQLDLTLTQVFKTLPNGSAHDRQEARS